MSRAIWLILCRISCEDGDNEECDEEKGRSDDWGSIGEDDAVDVDDIDVDVVEVEEEENFMVLNLKMLIEQRVFWYELKS